MTPLRDRSWCHTVAYISAIWPAQGWRAAPTPGAWTRRVEAAIERAPAGGAAASVHGDRPIVTTGSAALHVSRARAALKIEEGARIPATAHQLETLLHGHLAGGRRRARGRVRLRAARRRADRDPRPPGGRRPGGDRDPGVGDPVHRSGCPSRPRQPRRSWPRPSPCSCSPSSRPMACTNPDLIRAKSAPTGRRRQRRKAEPSRCWGRTFWPCRRSCRSVRRRSSGAAFRRRGSRQGAPVELGAQVVPLLLWGAPEQHLEQAAPRRPAGPRGSRSRGSLSLKKAPKWWTPMPLELRSSGPPSAGPGRDSTRAHAHELDLDRAPRAVDQGLHPVKSHAIPEGEAEIADEAVRPALRAVRPPADLLVRSCSQILASRTAARAAAVRAWLRRSVEQGLLQTVSERAARAERLDLVLEVALRDRLLVAGRPHRRPH